MAEITAAVDEAAANTLFDTALALIPPLNDGGSGSLGPFTAGYNVTVTFSGGDVDLVPPDTIRIVDFRLSWHLDLSFEVDLGAILPEFCLPQVCIDIPCVGEVCTPRICIDWPSPTVHVPFSDFLEVTADFGLLATLNGGVWKVEVVVKKVESLQFGATTAALLAAIGLAAAAILAPIPFIGPFLAIAVNAILFAIGIAGLTGFLGPILSPFVAGLKFKVYEQPKTFEVLPATSAVDPKVTIEIDAVSAAVSGTDEDELVLSVDISG